MKIIITNIPAFYKINLYNEIAKRETVLVVFTDDNHSNRNADFYKGTRLFKSVSLHGLSKIKKLKTIAHILRSNDYDELIISGWSQLEFWVGALLSSKSKNAVVVESSVLESETTGVKGFFKRCFIARFSKAYVSGILQKQLIEILGFSGDCRITKGVGLFNIISKPTFKFVQQITNFIYVGRFSEEKNLLFLIKEFSKHPNLTLNMIGFGPIENELKSIATQNVIFHGAIDNKLLPLYYQKNDVFILPSISEVWGLVVEEALNNGLPVIISDRVGCADEVIINNNNGIVFSLDDPDGFTKALVKIQDIEFYNNLKINVSKMDFEKIAEDQVMCYCK